MQVKIGDMGLATKLTNRGDKRNTLCGTPNYIAPEVLVKKGHSFEVSLFSDISNDRQFSVYRVSVRKSSLLS